MKLKKIILFAILLVLFFGVWELRFELKDFFYMFNAGTVPQEKAFISSGINAGGANSESAPDTLLPSPTAPPAAAPTAPAEIAQYPDEINLPVPFTPQAPHADWDALHKEACEEASALMAAAYVKEIPPAQNPWTADEADAEILKIVDWENSTFGFFEDTTLLETQKILSDYFGISDTKIMATPSVEDIKFELAKGKILIAPFYGRALGNPYYSGAGPLYHMMVIKGYTKDGRFITNDPGTKHGKNYAYAEDVIMGAMHDWNSGDVQNGDKVVLSIGK